VVAGCFLGEVGAPADLSTVVLTVVVDPPIR
jgi:hypothetical protein